MKKISINIHEFMHKFGEEYDFLYENRNNVVGYSEAVAEFDYRMKHDKQFNKMVCEFVAFRKDFISSDREAAAFMFTWADYEGQEMVTFAGPVNV